MLHYDVNMSCTCMYCDVLYHVVPCCGVVLYCVVSCYLALCSVVLSRVVLCFKCTVFIASWLCRVARQALCRGGGGGGGGAFIYSCSVVATNFF